MMPTIPWVESECGHYGSLFGAIGASGVRIALSHSSGSATTAGSHSPKLLSLAKAFTEQEDRETPGGRGVSGETGLGGNAIDTALTAESLKSFPANVRSQ